MPRGRSRSRSRSRSPKRGSRRRRSRSRSSSGSPRYERKRKHSSHGRRYSRGSRGSQSPGPRRFSQDRDRKPGRRSASPSPERGRQKFRSPKRPFSRSRSGSPPPPKPTGGQFESSVLGNSNLSEFEMRIRELQSGSSNKVSTFDDVGPGRQVKISKEEQAPGSYGPNPPRDQLEPTGNFGRTFSQQGYQANGGKDQHSASKQSRSPSPRRRRDKSRTPPIKHRKKSYSPPRRKSKYRSQSPSPRKRSKDSTKKNRRAGNEPQAKKSPPRSSRLGPGIDSNLIVIPRRKDEGTTPIFDRPEIPVYTIRDDPSLIAEGYFDKEESQRARRSPAQASRGYTQQPRDAQRAPSPTVTFSSTGLEKYSFPNSAAFFERRKEQPPQIVSTTLGEIHDRMRSSIQNSGLQVDHLPNTDLRLALDRKQLSPLRSPPFTSDLLSQETMLYEREKMNRSRSEERRPVKERLGGKDGGLPDFRKEVNMLNQSDPLLVPKGGGYYEHDNREGGPGRPPFNSPMRRPFRGRFSNYRGNRYIRGFRGRFSRGGYGYPYRGGYNNYQHKDRDRWTHDKFEDDRKSSKKDKHHDDHGEDKSSKKEKKSKKLDRERRSSHHKS